MSFSAKILLFLQKGLIFLEKYFLAQLHLFGNKKTALLLFSIYIEMIIEKVNSPFS